MARQIERYTNISEYTYISANYPALGETKKLLSSIFVRNVSREITMFRKILIFCLEIN